jgi:hypothetical protein
LANLGLAVVAAVAAVILGAVRSRRTGVEVGLLAIALALFGWRDLSAGSRQGATRWAWIAIVTVIAIAIEPHLH